jgi:hypothetical protein
VRFGVTHNDANISVYNFVEGADLGPTGPNGDQYFYGHTQMDLQGSYNLAGGVKLVLSGLNLNNEVFGFYQGSTSYPIQREFYGRTFMIGVNVSTSTK